jgi:hypothetical protein
MQPTPAVGSKRFIGYQLVIFVEGSFPLLPAAAEWGVKD